MRAVSVSFIRVLSYNSPEVFLVAVRVTLGFLASISRAVIAILDVFIFFKKLQLYFLFVGAKIFELEYLKLLPANQDLLSLQKGRER